MAHVVFCSDLFSAVISRLQLQKVKIEAAPGTHVNNAALFVYNQFYSVKEILARDSGAVNFILK